MRRGKLACWLAARVLNLVSSDHSEDEVERLVQVAQAVPAFRRTLMVILLGLIAWQLAWRRMAIGTVLALVFVGFIGVWPETMITLAIVLTSLCACLLEFCFPLGIWAARSDRFYGYHSPAA